MDRKMEALNKAIELAKLSDNYDVEEILDNAKKIEDYLGKAPNVTTWPTINTGPIYTSTTTTTSGGATTGSVTGTTAKAMKSVTGATSSTYDVSISVAPSNQAIVDEVVRRLNGPAKKNTI